jgi:arylformamidase
MNPWIDISVPIRPGMHEWPGDDPFRLEPVFAIERGDAYTVSRATMTWHVGTHMDAPAHMVAGAPRIDAVPLDTCIGPARVLGIRHRSLVTRKELERHRVRTGERLLLRTRNSSTAWNGSAFSRDFVALAPDAAEYLAERRIRLVGIDYLSIDPFHSTDMLAHKCLLGQGIAVVEGVNLARVAPGRYQLVCLPLRIADGDGSPVRAVIKRLR